MTGGRLKRVAKYVELDEAFCFTYGDGVSDVDISATIDFHRRTARPPRSPAPTRRALRRAGHGRSASPASWKSRAAKAA
jgi:hypothetical protein